MQGFAEFRIIWVNNLKFGFMKRIFTWAAGLIALVTLASCNDYLKGNNDNYRFYPNAVVTLKTTDDGVFYMQLDDSTTIKPTNISSNPYNKEVRALINFDSDAEVIPNGEFDVESEIFWMDSIRTKTPVLTTEDNDEAYGTAEIDIYNSWLTVLEDDYLTLAFAAHWNNPRLYHGINLVTGVDEEDPYLVELRHDPLTDSLYYYGHRYNGLIAFDLKELAADGDIEYVKIRYNSYQGEKTIELTRSTNYYSGSGTSTSTTSVNSGLPIE